MLIPIYYLIIYDPNEGPGCNWLFVRGPWIYSAVHPLI